MDICNGSSCNVILPHGLSEDINITRGVKQGCPLSPMLFILFLEPLILKLQTLKKGYNVDDSGESIPGGAYADDMVLHSHTQANLQSLLNTCVEYFQFIGLDISVDGRDKSVYTNNLTSPSVSEQTLKVTTVHKNKTTTKTLPFYKSKESYKYLGIWINLDLNWSDQTRISNAMYSKYLSYLYKKCFNASQTAEILNLVVFPSLTYRMNIIKFPAPTIKKWDKQARNLLAYKLRENQFIGSLHWYLPNNKYGYNLFKLTDLQTICLPANYLNYSANFIDVYARRSTLAIFDQSLITEQSATLLSRY